MQQVLRHQLWIVVAAGCAFFIQLGATHLWDEDETLHATCAREMYERGDWVVPTFNGKLFPDKPPLAFWLMIAGFEMFGVNEWAVRFWSALFGIGTALATYHLGRILFRAEVGLWAGLIMTSTLLFTVSARAATMDSVLLLATMLALLAFVGHLRKPLAIGDWPWYLLFYAALGVAVLAKGPVGVVLPVAALGLFLLVSRQEGVKTGPSAGMAETQGWRRWLRGLRVLAPRNLWAAAWQMRPLTALVIVGAIALPWYVLVGLRTDGEFLAKFFGEHNLGRALRPMQGHRGPIVYYIPAILIGFFPWSVFLGPSLVDFVRRLRRDGPEKTALVLVACWTGLFFTFWSLVGTKLPHYVLPIYPTLALITALTLDRWITSASPDRRWLAIGALSASAVGLVVMVVVPIVNHFLLPGEYLLGLIGFVPLAGGLWSFFLARRGDPRRAATVFAAMGVLSVTVFFGFGAPRVDRHQNAPRLLGELRQSATAPYQMVGFRFLKESFVWEAGHEIPRFNKIEDLRAFLHSTDNPRILTLHERQAELEAAFPGQFQVIARQQFFLQTKDVIVLARRAEADRLAARQTAACR